MEIGSRAHTAAPEGSTKQLSRSLSENSCGTPRTVPEGGTGGPSEQISHLWVGNREVVVTLAQMGGFLVLVGLGGILFGIINLVRPQGRLRIETRGRAGAVVAGSFVVMLIGGALLPPNSETDPVSSATTVVLSTSTSMSEASSTTGQPTTTSSSVASTTSLACRFPVPPGPRLVTGQLL